MNFTFICNICFSKFTESMYLFQTWSTLINQILLILLSFPESTQFYANASSVYWCTLSTQLLICRRRLSINHTLRRQFRERSFEVTLVGISVAGCGRAQLGFMVNLVPRDDILATGSDRSTNREDQPALECDLQQSQHATAEIVVGQVTNSWEAYGVICLTRIRMFATLNSGRNAEKIEIGVNEYLFSRLICVV